MHRSVYLESCQSAALSLAASGFRTPGTYQRLTTPTQNNVPACLFVSPVLDVHCVQLCCGGARVSPWSTLRRLTSAVSLIKQPVDELHSSRVVVRSLLAPHAERN